VISMTMLGYTLGNVPIVRAHFEKVVVAIVLLSVLPIIVEFLKGWRVRPAVDVR
jgi:membrane-associated protein